LYAIVLAIGVVGLVALGVPTSTLLFAALVLACPLMMMFTMGGMHGGHGGQDRRTRQPPPRSATTTSPWPAGANPAGGWRRSR
jgi:hypothetical protein